jgi:hypothetical protein
MLDIRDLLNLKEAYAEIYASQELTEEQVWEEVETWVNSLIEEGYDLSDYTWEEMYESYLEEAPMTAFQAAGGNAKLAQLNKGLSPRSSLRATAQSIERQGQQNLYKAGGGDAAIAKGPTRSQNLRGGGSRQVPTRTRQDVINRGTVAAAKPATPTKPATPAAARPAASTPARPAATLLLLLDLLLQDLLLQAPKPQLPQHQNLLLLLLLQNPQDLRWISSQKQIQNLLLHLLKEIEQEEPVQQPILL